MHVADFEEGPAAEAAVVVDRRDPVRFLRLARPPTAAGWRRQIEHESRPADRDRVRPQLVVSSLGEFVVIRLLARVKFVDPPSNEFLT